MGSSVRGQAKGPAVVVRQARSEDGSTLQRIDAATWTPEVSPALAPDPDGDFFGRGISPVDVLIAEVDGKPVGYVTVGSKYPGVPASDHVQQLKGLAVSPQSQGQGAGRRLVMEAAATARRRGARRVTLNVLGTNATARQLYERCGFVVEGVHPKEFYLEGRYVDDLVLALDLCNEPAG